MRTSIGLVLLLIFVQGCAQQPSSPQADQKMTEVPYQIHFDKTKDIVQLDRSPKDGKEGIYIKTRFTISLNDSKVDKVSDDYKVVIEENGKRVDEVDLPRPVVAADLSVMLVVDTSSSMKQHGRLVQAREACAVFLDKLSPRSDCGLILFNDKVRESVERTVNRQPLLQKINTIQPEGGTAFLDAAFRGIEMLRDAPRGRDRALVLVTDGIDIDSKKKIIDIIDEAKKERVPIYTIGIGKPGKSQQVNTVLVLDHSGSMAPPADDNDKIPKIKALHLAGEQFVDHMSSVGRASIVPFSTLVETPRPFMDKTQKDELKANINNLLPFGETALFDATYVAISVLEADGAKGKRAVIAMTDGVDNTSRRRVEEVIKRAQDADIPLYLVGFGRYDKDNQELDKDTMERMANETKGKFYHAKNAVALPEIFENLSIQLHDNGIDEDTLKRISAETKGKYYPAENVSELKLVLEQVTKSILRESYEIVFPSLNQRADGTLREVTLKLIQRSAGGADRVLDKQSGEYQRRGLIVAEMNHFIYLLLLGLLGGLIALPALLRRSSAP